jgi:hypothetical protein
MSIHPTDHQRSYHCTSVTFDTANFYENLSINTKFGYNGGKHYQALCMRSSARLTGAGETELPLWHSVRVK